MRKILLSFAVVELLVILVLAMRLNVAESQMLKLSKTQRLTEAAMLNAYLLEVDRGQLPEMTNVMRSIILDDIKMLKAKTYGALTDEDQHTITTIENSLNPP